MARGRSLLTLLQDLRAETRTSGNPAHNAGVRDDQVRLLQRTQERLYDEVDWPFLRVDRFFDLQTGQRYYDTPDEFEIDRIETLAVRYGQDWCGMNYGIGDEHLAVHDSDGGDRFWPVSRWDIYEDEQIEIWPVPAQNGAKYLDPEGASLEGRVRVSGIRKLRPLVADDDVADLDHRLIVLSAAAEMLAADGAKDAPLKLEAAIARKRALVGNLSKRKSFTLFGAGAPERRRGPRIPTVHYRDRETG